MQNFNNFPQQGVCTLPRPTVGTLALCNSPRAFGPSIVWPPKPNVLSHWETAGNSEVWLVTGYGQKVIVFHMVVQKCPSREMEIFVTISNSFRHLTARNYQIRTQFDKVIAKNNNGAIYFYPQHWIQTTRTYKLKAAIINFVHKVTKKLQWQLFEKPSVSLSWCL